MKNVSLCMAILFVLVACQPNPSQRIRYATNKENTFTDSNNNTTYGTTIPTRTGTGTGSGTGSSSGEDDWLDSLPSAVRGCSWSEDGSTGFASYHSSIGAYTICQNTNELELYIQIQNPPTSTPICLIPTNTNSGYTTYIGEPQCFTAYSSQQIYRITMVKNRTGATSLALNGVSIMKDESAYYPYPYYQNVNHPDAYLYCLQALEQYGDPRYCYAFDSMGQYVQNDF